MFVDNNSGFPITFYTLQPPIREINGEYFRLFVFVKRTNKTDWELTSADEEERVGKSELTFPSKDAVRKYAKEHKMKRVPKLELEFLRAAPTEVQWDMRSKIGLFCSGPRSGLDKHSKFLHLPDAVDNNTLRGRINEADLKRIMGAIHDAWTLSKMDWKALCRIFGFGAKNQPLFSVIENACKHPGGRGMDVEVEFPQGKCVFSPPFQKHCPGCCPCALVATQHERARAVTCNPVVT